MAGTPECRKVITNQPAGGARSSNVDDAQQRGAVVTLAGLGPGSIDGMRSGASAGRGPRHQRPPSAEGPSPPPPSAPVGAIATAEIDQ